MDATSSHAYFGEEMILNQFSLLAESIQKALPPDSQSHEAISQQLHRINSKKEKWPARIISLYRNRQLPVFSTEAVTKLNQAHEAFVNNVNDTRKRQKDSLKTDMARKQKQLDELLLKKEKVLELYESTAYKAQNEQTLYDPNSIEFARLASQVSAAQSSYLSSMTRLRAAENETSHDLTLLERDYIPIRLLSNQSNRNF